MKVYLDNASTTPVRNEVIETMNRLMLEDYGNPSSLHTLGRRAAVVLEDARAGIARALGVTDTSASASGQIIFTSGGTEANNLAIFGAAHSHHRNERNKTGSEKNSDAPLHIISSAAEHDAVKETVKKLEQQGWQVTYLTPDSNGCIPAENLKNALRENTKIVSVMLVNNETGAINPVSEYSGILKQFKPGIILHTDAVQGFCKIPFTAGTLGADLISISAHKIYGPKGVGALYVSNKIKLSPMIYGGGQENGLRSGTEALPVIAGFGTAARLGMSELNDNTAKIRDICDYTVTLLKERITDIVFISAFDESSSPYILSLSLPGFKSEVLMNYLDGEGIYVSKGSACHKNKRSPALTAMGLRNDIIDGVLRVSFSRFNTKEEAAYFVDRLARAHRTLLH